MVRENNIKNRISINLSIYPLEAIYSTAYVFVDRFYIYFDSKNEGKVDVFLKPKEGLNKKEIDSLEGEFMNELLNYSLRISLSKTNKKIRERVIERALYSSVGDDDDIWSDDDPSDILKPWEESELSEKK